MIPAKPVIVSNASPLINLARIGHLTLLQAVYGELVIPQAVWEEVVVAGAGQPGAEEVRRADWIRVCPVTDHHLVNALRQDLDAGEAEAIALAAEKDEAEDGRVSPPLKGSRSTEHEV